MGLGMGGQSRYSSTHRRPRRRRIPSPLKYLWMVSPLLRSELYRTLASFRKQSINRVCL